MSIPAWPSIEPARPRSAWSRAALIEAGPISRTSSTTMTIITAPPTNSAAVNCQPISRARMIPSSITRLVEAIWKAIAAPKSAPLRTSVRAKAAAA